MTENQYREMESSMMKKLDDLMHEFDELRNKLKVLKVGEIV
jgi:hypothetical protein